MEIMSESKLLNILQTHFGHKEFRMQQSSIIDSVLSGQDTIGIMPTGGGKSVCYQVPALYLDGVTVVISPLISLMQDQVINLAQNGIKASFLNSTQTYEQRTQVRQDISSGESKLLYLSPEGLVSGSMLNYLKQLEISLIAIDEAHCVSQWGHEFRKDYTKLGMLKEHFPQTPILALTATADSKTRKDIAAQLILDEPETFLSSFDRPNIEYQICERDNEVKQLIDFIKDGHENEVGIVYCLSRKKVEKIAKELQDHGFEAAPYHAGLSSEFREKVQLRFNAEEKIIIVATIAFGMGIDRPDVRFVAHLDLPKSLEGYYQETGRAGRDGQDSVAWMVYGLQDVMKLSQMLETTDASELYKKVARHKLDAMLSLCETIECRRKYLLGYFEEELEEDCGNCDSCLSEVQKWDATVDAQKLLSTIYRTGQVFGAGYIIDVLRGSKSQKVLDRGHDQLSVYGIGREETKHHWNSVLRQLLHRGHIGIKNWEYRNLCLTDKSGEILKKETIFEMRVVKEKKGKVSKRSSEALLMHGQDELFESLRSLRRELASENNVPPFVIFSDKTLHDMCHLLPKTKDDFLLVNGVGRKKCESYADQFMSVISSY